MKHRVRSLGVVVAALLMGLSIGCENKSDNTDTVGPDISGSWSGSYDKPGYTEPVTAKIVQDGGGIVIETSKSGIAGLFTGKISSDGTIEVMEDETGKTWTSLGAITANHIYIRDYLNVGASEAVQSLTLDR